MESISGQVLSLSERGYTKDQIAKELKITPARVTATLRQVASRSADSRRIFEVYEMALETLGICRELLSESRHGNVARRMKAVERGLPAKLGAAIDKTTEL